MARPHKILLFENDGNTLIVAPSGDRLSVEESVLKAEIENLHKLIDGNAVKSIVVDVSSAPYFGSMILGALIAISKRVTDNGGKAAICAASDGMLESLQIMRIDTIIPYFETQAEALAAVQS